MPALAIFLYLLVATLVVFFSIKLSDYVDLLDKKTNLSGAVLGGILLAAVTSLPELFTSLTATVFVRNNHLVLGNILGSDLFNITLFFIIFVLFFSKMVKSKINKTHLVTLGFMALLYVVVTIASFVFSFNGILWGWFNPISIAIVAVYALSIKVTPKSEDAEDKETNSKLTVKQIILLFILFSFLLIAASIGMTYLVEWIVNLFKLGPTFAGALFLGVATSLPEMTATITLCYKKNFNAAISDILGSCVFNFIILSLGDLLSFNCEGSIYNIDQSSFILIIFGFVVMIITFVGLIIKLKCKIKTNAGYRILFIILGTSLVLIYIAFLILSNIDLKIPFAKLG